MKINVREIFAEELKEKKIKNSSYTDALLKVLGDPEKTIDFFGNEENTIDLTGYEAGLRNLKKTLNEFGEFVYAFARKNKNNNIYGMSPIEMLELAIDYFTDGKKFNTYKDNLKKPSSSNNSQPLSPEEEKWEELVETWPDFEKEQTLEKKKELFKILEIPIPTTAKVLGLLTISIEEQIDQRWITLLADIEREYNKKNKKKTAKPKKIESAVEEKKQISIFDM